MVIKNKFTQKNPYQKERGLNMKIDNVAEFFYQRTSKRIENRIKEYKLKNSITYEDIYPYDPKQISYITHERRTGNNRFLVTDAVLQNFSKETGEEIGIVPKLGFKNCQEALWGNETEIDGYLPELFRLLWDELEDKNNYNIDKGLLLSDYIPYAKYSKYWEILYSDSKHYPALYYGIREDDVWENIKPATEEAINYLYQKCANKFADNFKTFVNSTFSFHKLNKKLERFIDTFFVPMLKEAMPDKNSLGLRVKMLIEADLSRCAAIVARKEPSTPVSRALLHASSTYVLELEKIQKMDICSQIYDP